ncbi:4a-hydroxytetrahydrobiopterin dehydratase [Allobranchiibius sp. CTAmp26]|uniref:4a-hydroxytetrahydrobiopterin dehydratase n=1 Tax=Allobranchiibius sp. CTAmp26 TaxID=2815214 RepID=UPI001AA1C104|nr:4a-hydroxytetrahydrobiopterin dehydratase [Allobranchiibius sp. CTAmp26]MBO1755005.1 4a-hydroxytetrahydrobiopterin dehydratase [Allobranchiibius sp. CTAmp26]
MDKVDNAQIRAAGIDDWRKLAQALHARYAVPDYATAAKFIAAVADAAESANHHPDVRLTYGVVDLSLVTHEAGLWVTQKDLDLAREISRIAAEHGLAARPTEVAQLELALDTADDDRVGPFWSALLTGSPDNRIYDSVFDPTGRVPSMWFQGTDEHETPRQRWHFDLWLAPEVASGRIAAAVAAGGVVVDEEEAPAFTVLADPDGNRVCICTISGRDG